jgi:hypothetical protein
MQYGGKLPAKVTRITNTGIHAVTARWNVLVRGIISGVNFTDGIEVRSQAQAAAA